VFFLDFAFGDPLFSLKKKEANLSRTAGRENSRPNKAADPLIVTALFSLGRFIWPDLTNVNPG